MKKTVPILFLICLLLSGWGFFIDKAEANNLSVSNVSLTDLGSGSATVQFTISWDNSWWTTSAPNNYDAAWVFIKYSTDSGTNWYHATLKTTDGDNDPLNDAGTNWSAGSGTTLAMVLPTDKKGVFLQRNAAGTGTVNTTAIKFVWDYATDGVGSSLPTTAVRVKVFAIEMVYVPTGSFYLGSGGSDRFGFYTYPTTTTTYQVTSENYTIALQNTNPNLWYVTDPNVTTDGDETPANILPDFPKGYNSFYVMKYEISQGQYADFLNTLTSTQWSVRYSASNYNINRYAISYSSPNFTTVVSSVDKKDRACNWLSWQDIIAYADWAGLRPMTELEFEKAARGTNTVTANEYAWGTGITAPAAGGISKSPEDGTETITTANANCNYNNITWTSGDGGGVTGPLRCGIFATSTSVRWTAGASYYGVMELSGNLWEVVVPVSNIDGRSFQGVHGDGTLDSNGNATVTNWSLVVSDSAFKPGLRGGTWNLTDTLFEQVSSRLISESNAVYRSNAFGGRLVRTAP
jgi:formylglycine-generating enzyme required for sulfatase activity